MCAMLLFHLISLENSVDVFLYLLRFSCLCLALNCVPKYFALTCRSVVVMSTEEIHGM